MRSLVFFAILGLIITCTCRVSIKLIGTQGEYDPPGPYQFISIKISHTITPKELIFFQICFIPIFPMELPDVMWNTNFSKCYIRQSKEDAPKYTAIGVPIRLGKEEYPKDIMISSLMYGNGIFEVEHFEYNGKNMSLALVVRNTYLLAGKYVAHLFKVKEEPAQGLHNTLINNTITTLDTSVMRITVKRQQEYCFLLPNAPEKDFILPQYEAAQYIKFLCDICWFDQREPKFMIKAEQFTFVLPSEMTPHPAFRRYFGYIRIASLPQNIIDVAYKKQFLTLSPGKNFTDLPIQILRAATPPTVEVYFNTDNERGNAFTLAYANKSEKKVDEKRFLFIYISPKIDKMKNAKIELYCKSTGNPNLMVHWEMLHKVPNFTIPKGNKNLLLIDDPYRKFNVKDIKCIARNNFKEVFIEETLHVTIIRHIYEENIKAMEFSHSNIKLVIYNILSFGFIIVWFFIRSTIYSIIEIDETESLGSDHTLSSGEESDEPDAYF